MNIKTLFALTLVLTLPLYGCGGMLNISGNGHLVTHEISVTDFDKLYLGSHNGMENMEVVYEQREDTLPYFQITVDENIFQELDILTDDNAVELRSKTKDVFLRPSECKIIAHSSGLKTIKKAGSGDMNITTPFSSPELEIELAGDCKVIFDGPATISTLRCAMAGSCALEAMQIRSDDFSGKMAGSNEFRLGGKIKEGSFQAAGSNDVKALECTFDSFSIKSAGSCGAQATIKEEANVKAAGSLSLKYKGHPEIRKKVAGSCSIEQIGD